MYDKDNGHLFLLNIGVVVVKQIIKPDNPPPLYIDTYTESDHVDVPRIFNAVKNINKRVLLFMFVVVPTYYSF